MTDIDEQIIEGTTDGIWVWNLNTNEVYFSQPWKAQPGYEDRELTKYFESWESFIHPDDLERARTALQSCLNGKSQMYRLEHRLRQKDGSYRWILVSGTALRNVDGKPYRMVGTHTDITERKQAEEALRQSENRFSLAFHASPIPMILSAPLDHARFIEVNNAWLRLMGYTRTEVIGHTWFELKSLAKPEQFTLMIERLQATGSVRNEEYLLRSKSGELRTVLLSAEVLELDDQPSILFCIFDINELKKEQHQLERRVTERTQELAALNEIATIVSRSFDLKEILKEALNKTMEMMSMDVGAAYGIQEGMGPIEVQFAGHTPPQDLSTYVLQHDVDFLRVPTLSHQSEGEAQQPTVWLVTDLPNPEVRQALEREGVRQIIHVPLLVKGKLVGRFSLGTRHERTIRPEELSLLSSIGQQIAVAVENGILYTQAEQSAAIAERQRLSRELHDSVTQSLYSVTMYAEAAARLLNTGEATTAVGYLHELRDTAQEALREMRLLIFELRPLALEKIGLVSALQGRLDSVEARGGTHTELQVEGVQDLDWLPISVEEELYHIAQEALNNVLKHAHARNTRVRLRFSDAETLLEIFDDGIGFVLSAADSSGGLGLASMTERAQQIGARLDIESAPGSGTRIRLVIPAHMAKDRLSDGSETTAEA